MIGFLNLPFEVSTFDGHNFALLKRPVWQMADGRILGGIIGGTSDGASTPRAGWNVLPPFGLYWLAAYAHDLGYRCETEELVSGTWQDGTWRRIELTKAYCDAMLLELMTGLGVDEATKLTIYNAVKDFGNTAFSDDLAQPIK